MLSVMVAKWFNGRRQLTVSYSDVQEVESQDKSLLIESWSPRDKPYIARFCVCFPITVNWKALICLAVNDQISFLLNRNEAARS
jgi:hypothetical protein